MSCVCKNRFLSAVIYVSEQVIGSMFYHNIVYIWLAVGSGWRNPNYFYNPNTGTLQLPIVIVTIQFFSIVSSIYLSHAILRLNIRMNA